MTATTETTDDGEKGMSESERIELNAKTKMPVGVALSCAVAMVGGALWINTALSALKSEIVEMRHAQQAVVAAQGQLLKNQDNYIDKRDLENWTLRMQRENPALKIPEFKR
jgi:hypothetical protein